MKEIYGKQVFETLEEMVDPKHTAVLLVDVLNDFYSHEGYYTTKGGKDTSLLRETLPALGEFLSYVRKSGMLVVHIPTPMTQEEVSPTRLRFRLKVNRTYELPCERGTWGAEFYKGFEPVGTEPVVEKRVNSGFLDTKLANVLRSNGIRTAVVTGCVTDGCVYSTAEGASDNGFYPVIPVNCVGAFTKEDHAMGLSMLRARYDLTTSKELMEIWNQPQYLQSGKR